MRKVVIVAVAIAIVLILVSCAAEPSGPRLEESRLVGEWKSGVEYRKSDLLYDYGAMVTIVIQENGDTEIVQEYYIKNRGEETWAKDLSSKPTALAFGLWEYPEDGGLKGTAELCDRMTFATLYDFRYDLSGEGDRLILKGEMGTMAYGRSELWSRHRFGKLWPHQWCQS